MSDETTLLSCPFCGGEATVERIGKSGYYYIACNMAYCCDFGKFDTEAEAIAAWNTRAELGSERIAELEAENERLRKAGYEIGYHDAMKAAKRGGTLTAEQVMAIAGKHQPDYCSDTHICFDWQAIADELNAELGSECAKCPKDIDVDEVYIEKIKPRLIGGTPTEDIRRWSILAHSVMEITGPSTFGADGNVFLWLHENSLTQLLDMCDAVDGRFAELGSGTCEQEERGWGTEGDHARVLLTCGHDCMVPTVADLPNYCPECGAKVVSA